MAKNRMLIMGKNADVPELGPDLDLDLGLWARGITNYANEINGGL